MDIPPSYSPSSFELTTLSKPFRSEKQTSETSTCEEENESDDDVPIRKNREFQQNNSIDDRFVRLANGSSSSLSINDSNTPQNMPIVVTKPPHPDYSYFTFSSETNTNTNRSSPNRVRILPIPKRQFFPLDKLEDNLCKRLSAFLDPKSLQNVAQTNSRLRTIFHPLTYSWIYVDDDLSHLSYNSLKSLEKGKHKRTYSRQNVKKLPTNGLDQYVEIRVSSSSLAKPKLQQKLSDCHSCTNPDQESIHTHHTRVTTSNTPPSSKNSSISWEFGSQSQFCSQIISSILADSRYHSGITTTSKNNAKSLQNQHPPGFSNATTKAHRRQSISVDPLDTTNHVPRKLASKSAIIRLKVVPWEVFTNPTFYSWFPHQHISRVFFNKDIVVQSYFSAHLNRRIQFTIPTSALPKEAANNNDEYEHTDSLVNSKEDSINTEGILLNGKSKVERYLQIEHDICPIHNDEEYGKPIHAIHETGILDQGNKDSLKYYIQSPSSATVRSSFDRENYLLSSSSDRSIIGNVGFVSTPNRHYYHHDYYSSSSIFPSRSMTPPEPSILTNVTLSKNFDADLDYEHNALNSGRSSRSECSSFSVASSQRPDSMVSRRSSVLCTNASTATSEQDSVYGRFSLDCGLERSKIGSPETDLSSYDANQHLKSSFIESMDSDSVISADGVDPQQEIVVTAVHSDSPHSIFQLPNHTDSHVGFSRFEKPELAINTIIPKQLNDNSSKTSNCWSTENLEMSKLILEMFVENASKPNGVYNATFYPISDMKTCQFKMFTFPAFPGPPPYSLYPTNKAGPGFGYGYGYGFGYGYGVPLPKTQDSVNQQQKSNLNIQAVLSPNELSSLLPLSDDQDPDVKEIIRKCTSMAKKNYSRNHSKENETSRLLGPHPSNDTLSDVTSSYDDTYDEEEEELPPPYCYEVLGVWIDSQMNKHDMYTKLDNMKEKIVRSQPVTKLQSSVKTCSRKLKIIRRKFTQRNNYEPVENVAMSTFNRNSAEEGDLEMLGNNLSSLEDEDELLDGMDYYEYDNESSRKVKQFFCNLWNFGKKSKRDKNRYKTIDGDQQDLEKNNTHKKPVAPQFLDGKTIAIMLPIGLIFLFAVLLGLFYLISFHRYKH